MLFVVIAGLLLFVVSTGLLLFVVVAGLLGCCLSLLMDCWVMVCR